MFRISVNMDLEKVKDDFIMGFSVREVCFSIAAFVAGVGCISIIVMGFHLPMVIAGYIAVPVVIPIGLIGFSQKYGMYWDERKKKDNLCKKNSSVLLAQNSSNVEKLFDQDMEEKIKNLESTDVTQKEREKLCREKILKKLFSIPPKEREQYLQSNRSFVLVQEQNVLVGENNSDYKLLHFVWKKKIEFDFFDYEKELFECFDVIPYLYGIYNIAYVKKENPKREK